MQRRREMCSVGARIVLFGHSTFHSQLDDGSSDVGVN